MAKKLEKLGSALFQPLTESEAKMVAGGDVDQESLAPAGGFTFIGRTQHLNHIDDDYKED